MRLEDESRKKALLMRGTTHGVYSMGTTATTTIGSIALQVTKK